LLVALPAACADRKQAPTYQLSLQSLGFPGVSAAFLNFGSSMLTVHFLDDSHLLVTFSLRKLIPRLPNDPPSDEDRLVAAEVVELPSGKVEARSEWHMHDHARYLWSMGQGRFIVRIGDGLYSMAPLANLRSTEPFELKPFPNRGHGLSAIFVSPDNKLVTVETAYKDKRENVVTLGDQDTATGDTRTVIDFYRIHGEGTSASPLVAANAGNVLAPRPLLLPVDADGYLWAQASGGSRWATSFNGFASKTLDLGMVDSSCDPRMQWVSSSEYLVLSCQGADDHIKLASYGLDGHETWEEGLGDFGPPTFVSAPASGRFAVSHVSTRAPSIDNAGVPGSLPPADVTRQEVRIYQTASGDLLLRVDCSPVIKTAENFDLSADGSEVAVVRDGKIAFYKLPPLSKHDREDMAEVAAFAPPAGSGPVSLDRMTAPRPVMALRQKDGPAALTTAGPITPTVTSSAAAGTGSDAVEDAPPPSRKPPTLLNPGEKAEMPGKKTTPDH
jgi:hypothetical protein